MTQQTPSPERAHPAAALIADWRQRATRRAREAQRNHDNGSGLGALGDQREADVLREVADQLEQALGLTPPAPAAAPTDVAPPF